MKVSVAWAGGLLVAGLMAGGAIGEGDKAIEGAVKARKAQMQLYAFNLGLLGDMAKGTVAYDSEAASKAAVNLVSLSTLDQSRLWPEGSDDMSVEGSRAMPAIWENIPDVMAKSAALAEAATAMAATAPMSQEALAGAMGALGGACGACHKAYRTPAN